MIVASTVSRREMLKRFGLAGAAAIALPELSRVLLFQRSALAREQAQGTGQTATLNAAQLAVLEAVCARIIPTDDNGPGATEARASQYIDRALGGWPQRNEACDASSSFKRKTRMRSSRTFNRRRFLR
jgi:Gluconate 2-dehydrogenase subunit 3